MECRSTELSSPKMDTETSSGHEPQSCDDTEHLHSKEKTNEAAVTNRNPESMSISLNDTSVANSSLDAFREVKTSCYSMQTVNSDSDSGDKLAKCSSDRKCPSPSEARCDSLQPKMKPGIQHSTEDHSQTSSQYMAPDTCSDSFLEPKLTVSEEGIICSNSHAGHKLAESDSEKKSFPPTLGTEEFENNIPVVDSPEDDKTLNKINGHEFCEDDAHANALKPAHSIENFANGVVSENLLGSSAGLCNANGCPVEVISDCRNAISYGKEAISDGICDSESSPQSCGAEARGDSQEERAESGSV